jgi:hypothetical protein
VGAGRLAPGTEIPGTDGATIGEFWAWAYYDILTNTSREIFAEFLVGKALGVVEGGARPSEACAWHRGDDRQGHRALPA